MIHAGVKGGNWFILFHISEFQHCSISVFRLTYMISYHMHKLWMSSAFFFFFPENEAQTHHHWASYGKPLM